jgi:hypothetical protein
LKKVIKQGLRTHSGASAPQEQLMPINPTQIVLTLRDPLLWNT